MVKRVSSSGIVLPGSAVFRNDFLQIGFASSEKSEPMKEFDLTRFLIAMGWAADTFLLAKYFSKYPNMPPPISLIAGALLSSLLLGVLMACTYIVKQISQRGDRDGN